MGILICSGKRRHGMSETAMWKWRGKELRDPIHGFIPVSEHELSIIQDPVFQRLRNIRQLSFAYLVYHGAEHSRFGHALGVMHVATRALSKIAENNRKIGRPVSIEESDVKLVRLAALLHDVGHHPFSHALDKSRVIREEHEAYSQFLAENHFAGAIEASGVDPKQVSSLIGGERQHDRPFLTTLINSQIDADKMDYLLRDSYYSGVKYGVYDLERVLGSLHLTEGHQLAVLKKGVFSAEQFVLSRYSMFGQVYAHKTKRCFEGLAKLALQHLKSKGMFDYPSVSDLRDAEGIAGFVSHDDAWLSGCIRAVGSEGDLHWHESIGRRSPFRLIVDLDSISAGMGAAGDPRGQNAVFDCIDVGLDDQSLAAEGIRPADVLIDRGEYLPYKLAPYGGRSGAGHESDSIIIHDPGSGEPEPIESRSVIVQALGKRVRFRRIYAYAPICKHVERYIHTKCPGLLP